MVSAVLADQDRAEVVLLATNLAKFAPPPFAIKKATIGPITELKIKKAIPVAN